MIIHWKAVEQYFTVALFVFYFILYFTQFVVVENSSTLDLARTRVKLRVKETLVMRLSLV